MILLDPRHQSSSASQKAIRTCPSPTNECVLWLSCLITGLSSNTCLLPYQRQIAVHAVFFLFLLRELAKLPASDGFKWPNYFLLSWFYLLRWVISCGLGSYIMCLCTDHHSRLSFQCEDLCILI